MPLELHLPAGSEEDRPRLWQESRLAREHSRTTASLDVLELIPD